MEDGKIYIHVSLVPVMMMASWWGGFQDDRAKRYVHAYIRDLKSTYSAQKTKRRSKYDWSKHFRDDWISIPYQLAGMDYIYERNKLWDVGQLLGDDVGLGKTIQAIGCLARWFEEGTITFEHPVIISCTSALKSQWADEIARFWKHPKGIIVTQIDGVAKERKKRIEIPSHIYILNWDMFSRGMYDEMLETFYTDRTPSVLLMDETQKITNPHARCTQRALKLASCSKCSISFNATPLENSLQDLWSLFFSSDPNIIGGFENFAKRYLVYDGYGRVRKAINLRELKKRIGILYIRRTRNEIEADLPGVIPMLRRVEMSEHQTKAYSQAVNQFIASGEGGAVGLGLLARAQRAAFCADFEDGYNPHSAKIDDLKSLLDGELSGERMVLFTRFRQIAVRAAELLEQYKPLMIHGQITPKVRNLNRRLFTQENNHQILICTEAGDRGLNLQSAGVVVNLDLPWNPSKLRQRVGRIARHGQTKKNVLCVNYVAGRWKSNDHKTIDDYFLNIIQRKRVAFNDMFGDDGVDEIGDTKSDKIDVSALKDFLIN